MFLNSFSKIVSAETITYSYAGTSATAYFNCETELFGNSKFHKEGVEEKVQRCTETNYINTYIDLDKYKYVVYKYEKALNIRVKRLHDTYYNVAKGNYKDVTVSLSSTITDEYEKSAVNSVSKSVAVSSGTEATDGITKVSFQASTSATKSVVSTIGETHSYTYNSGYSTTDHLEAIDYEKNYNLRLV